MLLILILCVCSLNAYNQTPKNKRLETDSKYIHKNNFFSLKTYFGFSSDKSTNKTNFELQINGKNVVIGNYEKVNWGIPCSSDTEIEDSICRYNSVNIDVLLNSELLYFVHID